MAAEMRWRSCGDSSPAADVVVCAYHRPLAPPPPDEPPPPEKPPPPLLAAAAEPAAKSATPPAATAAARSAASRQQHGEHHRAEARRDDQQDEERGQGDEPDPVGRMGSLRPVEPERRPLLPFRGIGGQHGDDVVDAAGDAAAIVAGLEARRDGVGDDHGGEGIGQRAFQAIAHFDAHPPLLGRHQQQHAVVLVLLAELPEAEQLVGIGLDLLALERAHRGDDELDARLLLELGELGLQRVARLLRDDVGLVDDAARERREGERQRDAGRESERDAKRQQPRHCWERATPWRIFVATMHERHGVARSQQ